MFCDIEIDCEQYQSEAVANCSVGHVNLLLANSHSQLVSPQIYISSLFLYSIAICIRFHRLEHSPSCPAEQERGSDSVNRF